MTKASKEQLKVIQTIFGGSIDYCKRNFRIHNGKVVETFYDLHNSRQPRKVMEHPLSTGEVARTLHSLDAYGLKQIIKGDKK